MSGEKYTVKFQAVGFGYRENPVRPSYLCGKELEFQTDPENKTFPNAVKIMVNDRHVAYVAESDKFNGVGSPAIKWLVENPDVTFIGTDVNSTYSASCNVSLTFQTVPAIYAEFKKRFIFSPRGVCRCGKSVSSENDTTCDNYPMCSRYF